MKFDKKFLIDVIDDSKRTVESQITGKGRWSIRHRLVFQHDGKFYETHFSEGATENQDEGPYEYENGQIECPEVFPIEKTVTVYEKKA